MKNFNQFNEGVRDKMLPKSEEDVKKSLDKLNLKPIDKIKKGMSLCYPFLVKQGIDELGENSSEVLQRISYYFIYQSLERGDHEIIKLLIDGGYKMTKSDFKWVVRLGNIKMIKLLIDNGSIVNNEIINEVYLRKDNTDKNEIIKLLQKHNVDK